MKIKDKLFDCLLWFLLWFPFAFITFVLFLSLFSMLVEYGVISVNTTASNLIVILVPLVVSIFIDIITIKILDKKHFSSDAIIKLLVIFTVSIPISALLFSIKKQLIYSTEDAKRFIPVLWSIFAISIGIFSIWFAFTTKKISNFKNSQKDKKVFFRVFNISFLLFSIFLAVDLITLILSTDVYLLQENEWNLLYQTTLIFCARMTSSTVFLSFMLILLHLIVIRKELATKNKTIKKHN